jgi:hypothetical protein
LKRSSKVIPFDAGLRENAHPFIEGDFEKRSRRRAQEAGQAARADR